VVVKTSIPPGHAESELELSQHKQPTQTQNIKHNDTHSAEKIKNQKQIVP
jgi:hypothetical protein